MSALTPLYLLGLLAVAAPIVFHLIRRAPKGEVPFSALMFLTPSPPRLTRRSRLDNILLLILRAAVLCLLAFAFARPFFREKALADLGEDDRRRTAILIDTSASLRRGDLWNMVRATARQVLDDCRPTEEIAVLAFDRGSRSVLSFSESHDREPGGRQTLALSRINELKPTWNGTDLGRALIDAVAAIEDAGDEKERSGRIPRRVVLITDLQQGSQLEALGEFDWPKDVTLVVKTVADDSSNAGLQRLADPVDAGADIEPRVRVSNDPMSRGERFSLRWTDPKGKPMGDPIAAYVPPGESRVVRVPRLKGSATAQSIVLTGDTERFDNTLYLLDEPPTEATVLFLGDDRADDPEGLLYYLMRVFVDTPRRTVRVVAKSPSSPIAFDPAHPTPLVILAAETSPENARILRDQAQAGATVLDVATRPGPGRSLATLLDIPAHPIDESPTRDAMLGEIAFDHPLFAPFAPPQFRDFTKIHFWRHRKLDALEDGSKARVVARFDDGDPALIEAIAGKGSIVVMASGWSRGDSQLARSSKFVPLMMAMLDRRDPHPFEAEEHTISDTIALATPRDGSSRVVVHKPSGAVVTLKPDAKTFDQTDEPGVYTIDAGDGPRSFVVNLDPSESKTAPMDVTTLEQYGCRLANASAEKVDKDELRQLQNAELEGRQKLWRWLILAAVGILIVETGLAGRSRRARPTASEGSST